MEGIEIVGSAHCEGRERCPYGCLPRCQEREACTCVSETVQVWGGSLLMNHCICHGCIRANGPQAQIGLIDCCVQGSQRPGVGIYLCENGVFLSHLYINAMILPRQARVKQRESTQKPLPFSRRGVWRCDGGAARCGTNRERPPSLCLQYHCH